MKFDILYKKLLLEFPKDIPAVNFKTKWIEEK
jgi:hypothetical protein